MSETERLTLYSMPDKDITLHDLIENAYANNYASGNLWHNYVTYSILNDENFFSLECERRSAPEGTLRDLAILDFTLLMKVFQNGSLELQEFFHNRRNTSPVCEISRLIVGSQSPREVCEHVADFYRRYGVGIYAFNKAFRFDFDSKKIVPVANENLGNVTLDDLVGYDIQKAELVRNTEAFIAGRPANNVLLYGDGGTGKSTSVKALLNEYFSQGLRVIELYKHQFRDILRISKILRQRNYKFIIFIDDLSFEEDESEYKLLKAIIEGGLETRPGNILIYATSNRRHIIREIWSDRDDMEHNGDIHRSDTVEEKLSLASRFGIAINYSAPTRQIYHDIVISLAKKAELEISESELLAGADRWEIRHGGKTGRAARQYIDYLLGGK
ncbi:MAG: ATP-binding protein [Synergistaceae bacterium]|nr:ATP-binding protein [Synergistaceae bacterium]